MYWTITARKPVSILDWVTSRYSCIFFFFLNYYWLSPFFVDHFWWTKMHDCAWCVFELSLPGSILRVPYLTYSVQITQSSTFKLASRTTNIPLFEYFSYIYERISFRSLNVAFVSSQLFSSKNSRIKWITRDVGIAFEFNWIFNSTFNSDYLNNSQLFEWSEIFKILKSAQSIYHSVNFFTVGRINFFRIIQNYFEYSIHRQFVLKIRIIPHPY